MLMERERSMFSSVGLGHKFWVEAVEATCYMVNKSPSLVLEDKTHKRYGMGKRTKLDSRSEKCIFIGYKDGLKDYKLWDPATRKVVYNRYVVFREVKYVIQHEVPSKEPKKIEFELKEEESDSTAEEESKDEEPQTPGVRKKATKKGRLGLDRVLDIHGFVDADWARDLDQRRSTRWYVFNLFGGAVSWMSKKQYVVALSTTEE
eukprot:PITA_02022